MSSLASSFIRPRKSFAKLPSSIDIPYLIEVQRDSYRKFLQKDVDSEQRQEQGLQSVFKSVFPVHDYSGEATVDFISYDFEEPKYTVLECRQRGMSYTAPLQVKVQLTVFDIDKETEVKSLREIKEQKVYFGEIPLMTENGTFIVNGAERVVVSQLHRSAGVFFDHDRGKNSTTGKLLFTARVIPYRGSWVDFEFDSKDILFVRIDRRRKLHASILLKALGYSTKELLDYFYKKETIKYSDGRFEKKLDFDLLKGQRALADLIEPKSGEVLVKKGRRVSGGAIRKMKEAKIEYIEVRMVDLIGKVTSSDILDQDGEILVPMNSDITEEVLESCIEAGISTYEILYIDSINADASFRSTLLGDKVQTQEEAAIEIFRRLRPGDPPTEEQANLLIENLFFNPDRYDLSNVGRLKLNERLELDVDLETRTLTKEDLLRTVETLLNLKVGNGNIDDIDHLGNRRVRAVGELLENQYRIGLLRIERAIRERLQLQDLTDIKPGDLINNKPATAVVKEFFGSSQLSQFMDQTNPLSEVTHKRRLSALGPGGLNRERAGFEVRDVHPTHYGRICPIETPEGPNIGLISSLAVFARVNDFGFIETAYRDIKKGHGDEAIKYYSASEEQRGHVIAQAMKDKDFESEDLIAVRRQGESEMVPNIEADLMDVGTNQLVSVAASLIPFLQNDDANRALMGSNMQRQAVPLLITRAPLVGTGMEGKVARDSGAGVVARRSGVVALVDADRIIVKTDDDSSDITEVGADVDIYKLQKYKRSNVDTCINQKPIVVVGEHVTKGDMMADGFATEMGELALGQNPVVAFMPWNGYNFEDSILLSERLVKDDIYTSVHIQEFECISRDTKLGQEEITADIPNVGEEALNNLDDAGIIRIGAEVSPSDLLVGKITPKGETQLTPEEKLLRAIFGEKAGDVRDTSLRVPPGVVGTVIGAKVFAREGAEKDARSLRIEEDEIRSLKKDEADRVHIIKGSAARKIEKIASGSTLTKEISTENKTFSVGTEVTADFLVNELDYKSWENIVVADAERAANIKKCFSNLKEKINIIKFITDENCKKIRKGDELPPGVIKMVKIYVAIKRKIKVGDKMAGRHGNKGVVSRILPEEDMPFLANGKPVDIVLNPLGVPSRMNVGQVLETHLGWAAKNVGAKINQLLEENKDRSELENVILEIFEDDEVRDFVKGADDKQLATFVKKYKEGVHFANPVFDGAAEEDIRRYLEIGDQKPSGQSVLFDGRSGNKFDNDVTVGIMYMLKLHHLVDEKIHARSTGPYSLVTQQPLGGKAQFGGQRLGEMEVWAMEAYGAAHCLQEFLTVKSDDAVGRTRMYESIVKGQNKMSPGIPESFNVLVKELQSLGLDVNLIKDGEEYGVDGLHR